MARSGHIPNGGARFVQKIGSRVAQFELRLLSMYTVSVKSTNTLSVFILRRIYMQIQLLIVGDCLLSCTNITDAVCSRQQKVHVRHTINNLSSVLTAAVDGRT